MLDAATLAAQIPHAFDGIDLPFLGSRRSGKVRDLYGWDDSLILITTDRLSAFDRILGLVPFKGQVLNQLSAFWFENTAGIIANHYVSMPDPNVTIARRCTALPVEVIVRGYITGVTQTALWYRYSQGERTIYGIDFPDGLQKNAQLPEPIITPTTKGGPGEHDERLTSDEVTERGLIDPGIWEEICTAAIALFRQGQAIAAASGLILVDTKYEFGLDASGAPTLIDEIHTPDSSRFWIAASYSERLKAGEEPENFDKEFVRLHYAAQGYRGDGEPSPMPAELQVAAAQRYIRTYEMLTGKTFVPGEQPTASRISRHLANWVQFQTGR
jgi:phosphoribosylaminoimidazole-succinocarboxamide synthase